VSRLHVVTHRRWVADDLDMGAERVSRLGPAVEVAHSLGLDPIDLQPGDGLWAPMAWAARLLHDPRHQRRIGGYLLDPGPLFTPSLDRTLTGRRIQVGTLAEYLEHGPDGTGEGAFVKPANCKIEHFPAAWRRRAEVARLAIKHDLPDDLVLQWTTTRLDIVEEHRAYVRHRTVVASSPYLVHHRGPGGAGGNLSVEQETWHEQMTSVHSPAAEEFAGHVACGIDHQPAAYVLDVALLADGSWVVLETNPVWAAAFYGCDLTEVVRTLFCGIAWQGRDLPAGYSLGHSPGAREPTWTWRPDPYLLQRVRRQRPL
jgi:hypothetical protein